MFDIQGKSMNLFDPSQRKNTVNADQQQQTIPYVQSNKMAVIQQQLQQQQPQFQQMIGNALTPGLVSSKTANNNTPIQLMKFASPHIKNPHKHSFKQQQLIQLKEQQLQHFSQLPQNIDDNSYNQSANNQNQSSNIAGIVQQSLYSQMKHPQLTQQQSSLTLITNSNSNANTNGTIENLNFPSRSNTIQQLSPMNENSRSMANNLLAQLIMQQQSQLNMQYPHLQQQQQQQQNYQQQGNQSSNSILNSYSPGNISINMNFNMNLQLNAQNIQQQQQQQQQQLNMSSNNNPMKCFTLDQQLQNQRIIQSISNPNNPYNISCIQDRRMQRPLNKLPKIQKQLQNSQLQHQQLTGQQFVPPQQQQLQQQQTIEVRLNSRERGTARISGIENRKSVERQNEKQREQTQLLIQKKISVVSSIATGQNKENITNPVNPNVPTKIKRQVSIDQVQDDDEKVKCIRYFRYHQASLLYVMAKKESYFTNLLSKKPLKTFAQISQQLGSKHLAHLSKGTLAIISKVKKLVATKGRYKYRERFNFMNSAQLKSLNYDVKKRLQQLQEKKEFKNTKVKDEESSSDDEDSPVKSNKKESISDMAKWKRANKIDNKTKVFIIKGGYNDFRRALLDRNWVENTEWSSPCFDLKWTCKVQNIDYVNLEENQVVNHFDNNQVFTSKYGLSRNLRTLIHSDNVDCYLFFPRCFDLADLQEFEDFIENFKSTKAESLLHKFQEILSNEQLIVDEKLELKILLCNEVVLRKDIDFYEQVDFIFNQDMVGCVSPDEWDIISRDDFAIDFKKCQQLLEKLRIHPCFKLLNSITKEHRRSLQIQPSADKPRIQHSNTQQVEDLFSYQQCGLNSKQAIKNKEEQQTQENKEEEADEEEQEEEEQEENKNDNEKDDQETQNQTNENHKKQQQLLKLCQDTLKKSAINDPQHQLNGSRNIWIVKPNFLSRGRGIKCFNTLEKIMDYVVGKETQFVVQKYIENPLLINNKKFDMRQWAIVQDFCPPRIWFYDECYLRLSSVDHSLDDLNNRFVHLTNNVVQKANKEGYTDKDDLMMKQEQFAEYLKEVEGRDVFYDEIQPKLKQMVIHSLKCCQDQVGARKNSIEFIGYDFMIDSNYQPWLIEINSSPSMEYSTSITKDLVQRVLEDTAKVIVDYSSAKKGTKKNVDTGGFKLIYKGDKSSNGNSNNNNIINANIQNLKK